MRISRDASDAAILRELGRRLCRCRLNQPLSQGALAEAAGVSRNPVLRLERGESVQLASFIRILRALGLLDNLDAAAPATDPSPMQLLRRQGRPRQRAPRSPNPNNPPPAAPT